MNNFDLIAPIYDTLAGVMFGRNLEESQQSFVDEIGADEKVLVLGGGTGNILELIPPCERIDYLDKSRKMLDLAQQRLASSMVHFIEGDFLDVPLTGKYDTVICQFFLDCFSPEMLVKALHKIKSVLSDAGKVVIADFCYPPNHLMSRAMHLFFRLFASIESRSLQDIAGTVTSHGFKEEQINFFHNNYIFSGLYRNL